jgi:hypothetical protein
MTLEEAIVLHGKLHLTPTNDWYHWPINPRYLPTGVVLPGGSHHAQNLALKTQLNALYSSADNQTKKEIVRYYIVVWGGIRKNSDETLRNYAFNFPESLIDKGCGSFGTVPCSAAFSRCAGKTTA